MKILVINGHKYYWYATGRLNRILFEEIINTLADNHQIKSTIIEMGYSVEEEIEKYKWADAIIYQNPINWYSVPWILKKYYDEVFARKIFFDSSQQYGQGGLMKGKKYMYSLTCGAKESDFSQSNGFFDMRDVDDIFIAQHKMHQYCGMEKIQTFCLYNPTGTVDIEREINSRRFHLRKYFK